MIRNSETMKIESLAGHFDAPDSYRGRFGWLCGYSADALFLDDTATRFTRLTRSQRAHQGRIALAVMLDPGNQPISILDAPGMAHLPIKANVKKPFRLLHAKVALLGFQHQENSNQWQLRLLVSTGNWTRQTLEESLDLVWRVDVSSNSLVNMNTVLKQNCSDIKASWELLAWIQNFFDTRLLSAAVNGRISEDMNNAQKVQKWIKACSKNAEGQPRVFDNRSKSLLDHLPDKVKINGPVKRNYLAMGSGFYEAPADHGKPPEVPVTIIDSLKKEGLLTAKPKVDLYVNPMACQAVATAVKPLKLCGVITRPAAIPQIVFGDGVHRNLHAKFVFSANNRENSNNCTSAWVYLGSGNLTHPGFCNKMNASLGNLEVGVVFFPNSLYWKKTMTVQYYQVVSNLLPIQWNDEIGDATSLSAGLEMEQRDAIFISPPIAWLIWHKIDGEHELRSGEPNDVHIQVLDSTGVACPETETGFQWNEAQPRQVRIRWKANDQAIEALIPVVDQYGRIAATKLPAIDIVEAWWQLSDFPLPPSEDEEDNDDDGNGDKNKAKGNSVPTLSYPIRQMMELVENIAAKQTEIDEMDWSYWCNCLEQILGQARDSSPVRYFCDELKLNPLSPLRHQSFRPSFAETCASEPGKLYEDTLDRIESSWKVNELSPIGGME